MANLLHYWLNIINRGSQITENYSHLLTTYEVEAKQNARRGEQLGDYERQLGASGGGRCVRCAPGLGEIKGTCTPKGSTPLGELGKRTNLGRNPKGRLYPNIARPGGIDITEGKEEMSARRTP